MLQRDPNKRLGSVRDAEDVKNHKFFKGIDWEAARRKELKPPPVKKEEVSEDGIPIEELFGKIFTNEHTKISGWSFISD